MPVVPDWARAHGKLQFHGTIRHESADFQVTEILGYELSGDGEHDFLWVEKQDANTVWVADQLAKHAGIRDGDVGFAGLKDRHALTRQWFSVRRPNAAGTDWDALDLPGVRILERTRHERKLRRGAHARNSFRIALRNVGGDRGWLEERLGVIRECGVPAYFGEQRFGRDGHNMTLAGRLFAGGKLRRNQRSFAISAARSWLFNHLLETRVRDGSWNRLQVGDRACLDGTNSFFTVTDLDAALHARCAQLDVHPGGVLWGSGEPSSHGAVRELEAQALRPFADLCRGLESHANQSHRALRLAVRNLEWEMGDAGIWLEFSLTRGGFATAVLREIAAT